MTDIVLIAHNLRSTHNIGSLLRTAEGLGVNKVIFSGYTPYPLLENDDRLPHIAQKINKQISKTALGAEAMVDWQHLVSIETIISSLKADGYVVAGLEQSPSSVKLNEYHAPAKIALILGREVEGLEPDIMALCDLLIEIPMFGRKESFNVVQAAAMALYQLRSVA